MHRERALWGLFTDFYMGTMEPLWGKAVQQYKNNFENDCDENANGHQWGAVGRQWGASGAPVGHQRNTSKAPAGASGATEGISG